MLFAIVFFRLWFLQVLTGEDYVSQARENRVRKIRIEAPRGDIVDRNGTALVKTRAAAVVQIVPTQLPEAELQAAEAYRAALSRSERERLAAASALRDLERRVRDTERPANRQERRDRKRLARAARKAEPVPVPPLPPGATELRRTFRRLARVLMISPRTIHRRVLEGVAEAPYSNVTIATGVPRSEFNYLRERRTEFPGVDVEKVFLRDYPHDDLAAQLFGNTGEISPEELKRKRYKRVEQGTRIGKTGIEREYDNYLRGTDGYTRVVINALGSRDDRRRTSRREPIQGSNLRLTLDLGLQEAAQDALKTAIGAANGAGNASKAGAFVAMDPRDGEILALGSVPSFDANLFAKPISQSTYRQADLRAGGRAAVQPGDRGHLSDRLDLQADHRDGGDGARHDRAQHADQRRRRLRARPAALRERRRRGVRDDRPASGDDGLLRRLLLHARRAHERRRADPAELGPPARGRAPDRDRHPRRVRRPRARQQVAQRGLRGLPALRRQGGRRGRHRAGAAALRRHRARLVGRRQRQPGGRPGRPAGHAAADGRRLLGDRQRRQGRPTRTSA